MGRILRSLGASLALIALLAPPASPRDWDRKTWDRGDALIPFPAWYRPVVVDGFTFPVARSNWLSVIEFRNDWHDPRFRLTSSGWQLIGFHEGNDIIAEEGTPVLSATAGTVERVGWTFYSGTRVGVRGTDGKYYFYAHLSAIHPDVRVGTEVPPGQVLGLVGNTGYGPPRREDEFPPHLHFGIEGPGGWENPFPLVRRLYRRSVARTTAEERRLIELGLDGHRPAFVRGFYSMHVPLWEGPLGW